MHRIAVAVALMPIGLLLGCSNSDTGVPAGEGGALGSGGVSAQGGNLAGAATAVGGATGAAGTSSAAGGMRASGGTAGSAGGSSAVGGGSGTAGIAGAAGHTGGASSTGGSSSSGGAFANGGSAGAASGGNSQGGANGNGGITGSTGGSTSTSHGTPVGDICSDAGTPLVAAHSLTRALYSTYSGNLFQVRRDSDGTTKAIGVTSAGGDVDLTSLNSFCASSKCSVAILYDQSGNGNDLSQSATANQPGLQFWTTAAGTQVPMAVTQSRQWLRNRTKTKKIPTGSAPQTEYMVVHAAFAGAIPGTNGCCYDYGNMERTIADNGPGTMSALYFGKATDWTRGAGNGPWAMFDLENGLFAGGGPIANLNQGSASVNPNDPSIAYPGNNIAVVLGKTDGTKNFTLKYGNAAMGSLSTAWSGSLPTQPNPTPYIPLQQEGGLSLGEGGDGSNMGTGAFSEGVVIASQTSDSTDAAIQQDLTSVYGR